MLKWDDRGIIRQHFLMRFQIWWSRDSIYYPIGQVAQMGWYGYHQTAFFDAISDLMVMWLYILPDWEGCSNGMIQVSLDSIFQCDFRSDGHMTLYITWLGRLLKWDDMGIIRQHFSMWFQSWWSRDSNILPNLAGCSNGMIRVSLDNIFKCDFRSDGHAKQNIDSYPVARAMANAVLRLEERVRWPSLKGMIHVLSGPIWWKEQEYEKGNLISGL